MLPIPKNKPVIKKPKTQVLTEARNFEKFIVWKNKKDKYSWDGNDILGYWLDKFYDCYGQDDPDFEGNKWSPTGYQGGNNLTTYQKARNIAERFVSSGSCLNGKAEKITDYIDWIFDEFIVEEEWFEGPACFWSFFKATDNKLFKRFLKKSMKPIKKPSKKSQDTYRPWGTGK